MSDPIRILLQTTIVPTVDDWHIGRFSLLKQHLESLRAAEGSPLCEVTARDRTPPGAPDPVLSTLDRSTFDELWLFAVDTGDGLHADDCAGISRFRARGGGIMATRDHMDLGSSVCSLGGIGEAHFFHSRNLDPDATRHRVDDQETPEISWPNYRSGANGDAQSIVPVGEVHPLLRDPDDAGGVIRFLPAHPHEGAVGAPAGDETARIIATGTSRASGVTFNLAVAFEPTGSAGPGLAESTFHHFADYNWDSALGCPSFVTETPGDGLATTPHAMQSVHRYVENAALWLAGRSNGD